MRNLGLDGRTILSASLWNRMKWHGLDSFAPEMVQVSGSCWQGSEPLSSIEHGNLLTSFGLNIFQECLSAYIAPSTLNLGNVWRWVVSFTSWPLYPWVKSHPYPWNSRLGVTQIRTGIFRKEKNLLPLRGIELHILNRPASRIVTILTELLWLKQTKNCSFKVFEQRFLIQCSNCVSGWIILLLEWFLFSSPPPYWICSPTSILLESIGGNFPKTQWPGQKGEPGLQLSTASGFMELYLYSRTSPRWGA
jgi:hypothetical protein